MLSPNHPLTLTHLTADPQGLRVAESTGPLLRVVEVPRASVANALALPELHQPGLLCLLAPETGEGAYVRRMTRALNLTAALDEAWLQDPRWRTALLVTGRFGAIPATELANREYWLRLALDYPDTALQQGGVYGRSEPAIWPELPVEGAQWAESAKRLIHALGHALRPAPAADRPVAGEPDPDLLTLTLGAEHAHGRVDGERFVLLQGSAGRRAPASQRAVRELQDLLIAEGVLTLQNEHFYLTENHDCDSAGQAASLVLGRSSTGFFEWKRPNGETLAQQQRLPARG